MMAALWGLATIYALWLLYVFVMNIKRARDAGTLTRFAYFISLPPFVIGLTLDAFANVMIFTVLLCELPREWLVTARLKRHAYGTGWRRKVARWFANHLLDPFDPDGAHVLTR